MLGKFGKRGKGPSRIAHRHQQIGCAVRGAWNFGGCPARSKKGHPVDIQNPSKTICYGKYCISLICCLYISLYSIYIFLLNIFSFKTSPTDRFLSRIWWGLTAPSHRIERNRWVKWCFSCGEKMWRPAHLLGFIGDTQIGDYDWTMISISTTAFFLYFSLYSRIYIVSAISK